MKHFVPLLSLLLIFLFPVSVNAVCPVCTVAVAGGLGMSRWIGIDDTVTGIWIGGVILSSGLWLADWMGKKGWKMPFKELVSIILFYLFVIPPLYWTKMIGVRGNILWGIDKIVLGIVIGSTLFLCGVWLDKWLRSMNQGKVYVYFQKVIAPVFLLTLGSFILYLVTN